MLDLSARGKPKRKAGAAAAEEVKKRTARVAAVCKRQKKQVIEEWTYLRLGISHHGTQ